MWLSGTYMSLSALPKVTAQPIFACPHQITCFVAGDKLAKVNELVGNITNVTLYVNELNEWSAEDLQLEENNILLHFTFVNTQPNPFSFSNVVIPPHLKELLDGLDRKRELPKGDKVMSYVSRHIDSYSNAVRRSNMLF
jgi:hypothetical protein